MKDSENLTKFLRILNIAFYRFVSLKDLPELKKEICGVCQELGIKGTILISSEGVNGYLAGEIPQIRKFQEYFDQKDPFSGLDYKESYSDFIPFQKMMVKIKKEIIPTGDPEVKPETTEVRRLSAKELHKWLDENKDFDLLDTRNDYEIEYGTFKKATDLKLKHFRDFSKKLDELPPDSRDRPMVMFCTGGIRCEKAGIVAMQKGFQEVYQLDGGILRYFEECGGDHYRGDCFVFDERVALSPDLASKKDL